MEQEFKTVACTRAAGVAPAFSDRRRAIQLPGLGRYHPWRGGCEPLGEGAALTRMRGNAEAVSEQSYV
jgi:hypothetical protein